MAKKDSDFSFEDDKKEIVEEVLEKPKQAFKVKIKLKVINIVKDTLFLEDEIGTQYRLPVSEYFNSKIGDIINL